MTYLIAEILISLILAAAIGFAAAWVIRGILRPVTSHAEGEARWSQRVTSMEAEHDAVQKSAEAANARLRADLHAAQQRAEALEASGGQRNAELEHALKIQARAAEAMADERGQALEQLRNAFNTAHNEWRGRIAAVEEENGRLTLALDAAESATADRVAQSAEIADYRADIEAKAELISGLEGALRQADREVEAARAAHAGPDGALVEQLRQRIAELEAGRAGAARRSRPTPPEGEDDLQALSGIGPVLEKSLKANGILTYRAIARLSDEDQAELGRRLRINFADRMVRERWAEQARAQHIARYGDEP